MEDASQNDIIKYVSKLEFEVHELKNKLQTLISNSGADNISDVEHSLMDYRAKLQVIIDNSSIGLVICNPSDGKFLMVNPVFCRLLGYSNEELLGMSIGDVSHSDDMEESRQMIKKLVNGQIETFEQEKRYIRKDGEVIWGKIEVRIFKQFQNNQNQIFGIIQNISSRKNIELALIENEVRFHQVFEHIKTCVAIYQAIENGGDFLLVDLNRAGQVSCRLSVDKLRGKRLSDIFPHIRHSDLFTVFQRVWQTGISEALPLVVYLEDRIIEWVDNYVFKLPSGQIVAMYEDTSEKHKAEQALKESEERYKHISESIADYIYKVYLRKGAPFQTIHSPACETLLGYTPEEFITNKYLWFNIIYKPDRERVLVFVSNVLASHQQNYIEHRVYKKDGQLRWIRNNIILFKDNEGEIYEYDGVIQDITDRKIAEEELIVAKIKAEESDRLKTAFLQNMSHEIRTPMNGIIGFAYMLQQDALSDQKRDQYTKIIIESSNKLLSIVNDILEISKIEAGQVDLKIEPVSVYKILSELYTFYQHQVIENTLDLELIVPSDDMTIMTDRTKLYQILNNLLNNAFKFTENGKISFGYEFENEFLKFFVKDTGIGIPENLQTVIFERFRQVEIDSTRRYGGTGLGLSISKKMVEIFGGTIELLSKENEGSTFFFTIPANLTQQNQGEENKDSINFKVHDKDALILIVEDEKLNMYFLEELLKSNQLPFVKAENGKEAVEICTINKNIALVLMDIKMPVMNGLDATREIKKICPNLPIIAQSAFALDQDKKAALNAGCDDFISKPINLFLFKDILKKYLP